MTDAERREAARQFCQRWTGKGKEDEHARSYWIEFLQNVIGMDNVTERVDFEKKVIGSDGNTKRIDAYIPETRVLIEQKSLGIALDKPQQGHDGVTPYEQAKMYDNYLPFDEKSRWIVLSNFAEIWVYDLNEKKPEPKKFLLSDIQTKYSAFEFFINKEQQKISEEMELSMEAGEIVGLIYNAFLKEAHNPESEETLKHLNMLCVRLVFCLYAEDAKLFGTSGHMFHDYLDRFKTEDLRKALKDLFEILNTPVNERDEYDTSMLSQFPYVNGGLFAESVKIPPFTEEIRDALLNKASEGFDWSRINSSIFGALFESTLNPVTRRSGGMHFTALDNLKKVIDPLFLNDLKDELDEILEIQVLNTKKKRLEAYQDKLASLKWMDPACGSGNFLTFTYTEIRRLENKAIRAIFDCDKKQVSGQIKFLEAVNPIKVSIEQFYGIEINDYAVSVAKTAFWIAESQMMKETENILAMNLDFLPLRTQAHIVEGNALKMDWNDVCPKEELNYIMGNPPFVGAKYQSKEQHIELLELKTGIKDIGLLDYVGGWYIKAARYCEDKNIHCAFVSTNSITQGMEPAILWKYVFGNYKTIIEFAYRTFVWDSETTAKKKAKVHCVIIGFCNTDKCNNKKIYDGDTIIEHVENISPYLMDSPNILIEKRATPICNVPKMIAGNKAVKCLSLMLSEEEKNNLISQEPKAEKYIKKMIGSEEFINNIPRYCLWLVGISPGELKSMPLVMKRVEKVKEDRLSSTDKQAEKLALTPWLFRDTNNPESAIVIPLVSSQRRRYIPMGYIDNTTIANNKVSIIPDGSIYEFGVLMSNVHNAWMRVVAMRMKSDYSYSLAIVYNNFPWPSPSTEQKKKIEITAQGILDARALYPDSSLADLYDPLTMPPELQKAHIANDKAVMQAYGFDIKNTSEADCVAALMKMYQELTSKEKV